MDLLIVEPSFQPLLDQLGLCGCAQLIHFFTNAEKLPFKGTWLKAAQLGMGENSTSVFYKQYSFPKPSWRFLLRASKARRELENYDVFKQLGIPCAQRIACGEERDWLGRLKRAFIITQVIPNVSMLQEFVQKHCPNRADRESRQIRRSIIEQLAQMTRRIHQAGFCHNDLYWRNILVQWNPGEMPKLWWIDCPRGRFAHTSFFRHRGKIKDLAALDKLAEKHFTRRERIEFIAFYLGEKRLGTSGRRLVCDTLAYRKKRWLPANPIKLIPV